jgi:O-antigen ligase
VIKIKDSIFKDNASISLTNNLYIKTDITIAKAILCFMWFKNGDGSLIIVWYILYFPINNSGGRTGYIVLFFLLFLVVFLVYKDKLKKGLYIFLSIVFLMSTFMYNFSEQFDKRVKDAKNDVENMIHQKNFDNSIGLRIIASYYSIEVIKNNFIFGVGTGDVMQEIEKLSKDEHPYILKRISSPHNVYLQVFAQIGFIGFLIMMLMFYQILRFKTLDKKQDDIIKIVTIASLIFMIPGNFFDFFELAMFVTIISAMVATYRMNINIKEIDKISILNYILVIIIFLIIGITK